MTRVLDPRRVLPGLVVVCLLAAAFAPRSEADFTLPPCQGTDVLGRGASFAQAAQGQWEVNFRNVFCAGSNIDINYDPAGSGNGINGMIARAGNSPRFGGTDDPPTTTQINNMNAGTAAAGDEGQIHLIPAAVGAVAALVNLPSGCDPEVLPAANRTAEQNLDGDGADDDVVRVLFTKAQWEGIWARQAGFQTWAQVFPDFATCAPTAEIVRVARFDNSGTTFAFKDYLNRIDGAEGWLTTYQTGTNGNREWPGASFGDRDDCGDNDGNIEDTDPDGPGGGLTSNSDGLTSSCSPNAQNLVAKLITTEGSVGYADVASARTATPSLAILPEGNDNDTFWTMLPNGSNQQQEPTIDTTTGFRTDGGRGANCTQTQFVNVPTSTLGSWAQTSGVNSPTGYGLCTLTYGLLFDDNATAYGVSSLEEARARTVKDYWTSIVSDSGQNLLFANDYTPLPGPSSPVNILAIARAGVDAIGWNKAAGGPGGGGGGGGGGTGGGGGGGGTTPPPIVTPSNVFSVPSTRINRRNGQATFSIRVPGAGAIEVAGSASLPRQGRRGTVRRRIGRVRLTVSRSGTYRATLKPSAAARRVLRRRGSLRTRVTITYRPEGGTARSSTRTVTLKLQRRRNRG
jgi:ABC-type phosphate transport system substrate-binding protein